MNNNKISDNDFREEELFEKFLKKQAGSESVFCKYTNDTDKELDELQKLAETTHPDKYDNPLEHINEILPKGQSDKQKSTGVFGKIPYIFSFISGTDNIRRISAILIPAFLFVMLVLNVLWPTQKISELENRALAQFPKVSFQSLTDGTFSKGFEDFISDQFVFRKLFVSSKRRIETLIGKKENHGILMADDGYLIENSADLTRENIATNLKAIEDLASVGRYNITCAVVPTAYEILNDKLPSNSYTNVYDRLYKQIKDTVKSKNVKIADVKPVLQTNKDKNLYYRTDHHQTAHGSYYLYTALAKQLSFEPYPIERFKIEEKATDFYGTTWSNSGFAPTKADKLYKYTLDANFECSVDFPYENKTMNSLYSDDMLKTKDKYSYYLDGNHGIAEIKSTCNTGKRIAIIKDSYAHSLVPFLANHYSRIYMVDLRYFNADIFEYLYNSDVKDVLVLYNQNTFMTDNNLSKISTFAKVSPYNSVPDVNYGIVPEQEKVDSSYFDDAVFVGDSLTMGISYFAGFNSEFLCIAGLSTKTLTNEPLANGKTVYETIPQLDRMGKIYIMLGTNEMALEKPGEYIARYGEFIDYIREYFPNVIIYLQSIMPVSIKRSETSGIKNYMATDYNKYLLDLAKQKQCYYVDLNSYFANEEGFLPEEAGGDGIHLSPENYRKLADYLKSHAVDVVGVKKIGTKKASLFKGGKYNTEKIGSDIIKNVAFKDKLSKVSDALVVSHYGIDESMVLSASLYMGGGSTAEEVAVFEADSSKNAQKLVHLIKRRVENKKGDFKNYMPAEMTKLNSPFIVTKGNVVVLCIADSADRGIIEKCIK